MKIRSYLIVNGADDLIDFLKQTFDAEVVLRVPTPGGTVMHAEVRVGDSIIEMGDAGGQWEPIAAPQHAYVDDVDCDGAYAVALRAGATSVTPPEDKPNGERQATVNDPFGNQWYVGSQL